MAKVKVNDYYINGLPNYVGINCVLPCLANESPLHQNATQNLCNCDVICGMFVLLWYV